jgi:pyruvate dehydrogenase E1 component beta subunit
MLLKAAIRDDNPVIFLENELLYSKEFEVTNPDFYNEEVVGQIGKAKIMREGSHVTLVSFSRMVGVCLEAAEQLEKEGISAEVINLRTIKPMDRESIINSVKKTGRLVAVEDGYPTSGVTAEILSAVMESPAFDYLDAAPQRVTAWDIPMPYAKNLETMTTPQAENVVRAVQQTMKGVKL